MTVLHDRIAMADANTDSLDELFERLERMPVPEGYKAEVIGGNIFMTPQRTTHWRIIAGIYDQLRVKFPLERILSDVRIDYPGHLNGFASDLTLLTEEAVESEDGRWSHKDVAFVAEVISRGTAPNDYGPKLTAYAVAEIPVYLVADPYQGRCNVYTDPTDGDYAKMLRVDFGKDIDLTGTVIDLVLKTDGFPRD
ncbi:Uma2 family endonuclease [Streptomyces sp. 4F14]|uniref:Uma2 family endonuclease n=1 Tax=Streptomyces sp. 4F14 TaxID=3394380 RepID=UPI003A8BFB39